MIYPLTIADFAAHTPIVSIHKNIVNYTKKFV